MMDASKPLWVVPLDPSVPESVTDRAISALRAIAETYEVTIHTVAGVQGNAFRIDPPNSGPSVSIENFTVSPGRTTADELALLIDRQRRQPDTDDDIFLAGIERDDGR